MLLPLYIRELYMLPQCSMIIQCAPLCSHYLIVQTYAILLLRWTKLWCTSHGCWLTSNIWFQWTLPAVNLKEASQHQAQCTSWTLSTLQKYSEKLIMKYYPYLFSGEDIFPQAQHAMGPARTVCGHPEAVQHGRTDQGPGAAEAAQPALPHTCATQRACFSVTKFAFQTTVRLSDWILRC